MKKLIICLLALLAILILIWVFFFYRTPKVIISASPKPVMFFVEIAKSGEEKAQGLMYRTSLPENRGMLFEFQGEEIRSFWMKNMLIPLDVIFAASDGRIVSIKTMLPCQTDDCPAYSSDEPARYALEINAGLSKKYGLKPGDRMSLIVN